MAWSPDSRSIAFTHTKRPGEEYWTTADISEVEVESGVVKPLAATGASESEPFYSPDGRWIVFQRTSNPPRWAIDGHLMLLPRAGGEARELAATFDEWPWIVGWDAASRNILFLESKGTKGVLYAMPLHGPPTVVFAPQEGVFTAVTLAVSPDWAVLIELDGAERLYFVLETKSSLFTDDIRDREDAKIECGKAHFKALAVGNTPAEFVQARNLEDVKAKV